MNEYIGSGRQEVHLLKELIYYNLGKAEIHIGNLSFAYKRKKLEFGFGKEVCLKLES